MNFQNCQPSIIITTPASKLIKTLTKPTLKSKIANMKIQTYLSILIALAGVVSSAPTPTDDSDAGKTINTGNGHSKPVGNENQASHGESHGHAGVDVVPPPFIDYY
ncbi:hypothetical protein F4680DRAFT_452509 [Xylaria scruposa]|nr:hypothetical protein F4680DRAFT_452509 [Xylaria scruposa]